MDYHKPAVRLARTRGDWAEVSAQRGTSGATNGRGGRSAPAPAQHHANNVASGRIVRQTTLQSGRIVPATEDCHHEMSKQVLTNVPLSRANFPKEVAASRAARAQQSPAESAARPPQAPSRAPAETACQPSHGV